MTISISRQPRFQKILGFLSVAVVLAALVVAVMQTTATSGPRAPRAPEAPDRVTVAHQQSRFQAVQDGYLAPAAFLAQQAQVNAFLELQDAYLPPAEPGPAGSGDESAIQDGYLPPEGWTAESQAPRPDAVNLGSRGPQ